MLYNALLSIVLWTVCTGISDVYYPHNVSRDKYTLSGIAAYRSALTLDWLAAEDSRQREMALAFQTEATIPEQVLASDCVSYSKPASGKVARLMLELLKNLEGDDGTIIPELMQALIRTKLLVETSLLEAEPDLDSLVKTPEVMKGEPHSTFPRILAMTWMAAADPSVVKKMGWCSVSRITKYLLITRPVEIAKNMRNIDPVIARVRYVMEEFIHHVTPAMYDKKPEDLMRTPSLSEIHRSSFLYLDNLPRRSEPNNQAIITRRVPHYYANEEPTTAVKPLAETSSDGMMKHGDQILVHQTQKAANEAAGMPRISAFLFLAMIPMTHCL